MNETNDSKCPKCGAVGLKWRCQSQVYNCPACGEIFSPRELLAQLAALAAEIDRLERLAAALDDDKLAGVAALKGAQVCFPSPRNTIEHYRQNVREAAKGAAK